MYLVAVQGAIVGALLLGQLHPDHHLLLFGQVLHILLHAPQQQGLQLRLQAATEFDSSVN